MEQAAVHSHIRLNVSGGATVDRPVVGGQLSLPDLVERAGGTRILTTRERRSGAHIAMVVSQFPSELAPNASPQPPQPRLKCRICTRHFRTEQARIQHQRSHSQGARVSSLERSSDIAQVRSVLAEIVTTVVVALAPQEREAELAQAEERKRLAEIAAAERSAALRREADLRQDRDETLGRRGSKKRHQCMIAQKMNNLARYDEIAADGTVSNKSEHFEEVTGVAASNVRHWLWDRAEICRAAGQERAKKLLRIDRVDRSKGKYAQQEQKLYAQLKACRRRGRRCSLRWLTHTMRQLVRVAFPNNEAAAGFVAGPRWRRRFLSRFRLTTRAGPTRRTTPGTRSSQTSSGTSNASSNVSAATASVWSWLYILYGACTYLTSV